MDRRRVTLTDTDASLLGESTRADTLIHETFHCLLVRSPVELVALLVSVAACSVCDFPLAQQVDLVPLLGTVVSFDRERKVLLVANALSLAAQRTDAKLGDALVRVATLLFVVSYRQTGGVLGVRNEPALADALLLMAEGVCGAVGAVRILLTWQLTGRYDGMTRVLVDYEMVGTSTTVAGIVAMREMIVHYALLIGLAVLTQGNGFAQALLSLSARNEAVLAHAQLGFLVADGVFRVARALASYLIGRLDNGRLATGLIPPIRQLAVACPIGARAPNGSALEHFTVLIIVAVKLDQFAGTNGPE